MQRPDPAHALVAVAFETKNPRGGPAGGPGLRGGDLQVETWNSAVRIPSGCLARLEHALRGQGSRHLLVLPLSSPTPLPPALLSNLTGTCWTSSDTWQGGNGE